MAGWAASTKALPSGPPNGCSLPCARLVYARDEGHAESGYGLETEYANLDAHLLEAIADLMKALEALRQTADGAGAAAGGDDGGSARLARRTGAGADRRRDGQPWLAGRHAARLDRCSWGLRRACRSRTLSTGSRSIASTGREMISASTATGSTRPGPSSVVLKPAHGALTPRPRCAAAAIGTWQRRAPARASGQAVQHFAGPSPFRLCRQAEVLVVTDIKRGDVPRWPTPMPR
jgi:ATP-dependent DNA helicase DinG